MSFSKIQDHCQHTNITTSNCKATSHNLLYINVYTGLPSNLRQKTRRSLETIEIDTLSECRWVPPLVGQWLNLDPLQFHVSPINTRPTHYSRHVFVPFRSEERRSDRF